MYVKNTIQVKVNTKSSCKNVIGKILENMMTEHQIQTTDEGPSCLIDKKTINKWHNADTSGGSEESYPLFIKNTTKQTEIKYLKLLM